RIRGRRACPTTQLSSTSSSIGRPTRRRAGASSSTIRLSSTGFDFAICPSPACGRGWDPRGPKARFFCIMHKRRATRAGRSNGRVRDDSEIRHSLTLPIPSGWAPSLSRKREREFGDEPASRRLDAVHVELPARGGQRELADRPAHADLVDGLEEDEVIGLIDRALLPLDPELGLLLGIALRGRFMHELDDVL